MDTMYDAHTLIARAGGGSADPNRPPVYKIVGLCLAIASGLFIGTSFVLKKVGLLKANEKYNEEAGEGYGYLKNYYWWGGMTLMIIGEICNFVAYAFVDAILVTPLGALSVVVTTILSAIFLKERLSFVGKVGCFNCIIGSVVIVLNAPEQSAVADIQQMQHFVISPGFLTYAGVIILVCAFIAWWAGPRYGKKSMLVYLSICSLIGGLSVVATQGLGSAIVAQAGGKPQFNQWFLYVLLVFVVATLLTEIIYLNKALNLFNAALVTPTYYVIFTSATIITSAILFRGFKGTPISIVTVIMGFFQICTGVILLQLSKSSKDVPDAAVFNGDLDQIRQVGEQEQPESDPKADAIRGTAALVRRLSSARQKMEQKEFERLHQEKMQDQLEPVRENEIVEWDGLRRRKTVIGDGPASPIVRRKTLHPPLGMSDFPDPEEERDEESANSGGVFGNLRSRASTIFSPQRQQSPAAKSTIRAVPMTEIVIETTKGEQSEAAGTVQEDVVPHTFGLPAALRRKSGSRALWSQRSKPLPPDPTSTPQDHAPAPPNSARRQWSFTNFMGRHRSSSHVDGTDDIAPPTARRDVASQGSMFAHEKKSLVHATEEERLGLVKGDSIPAFPIVSPEHLPRYPDPTLNISQMHSQTPTLPQPSKPPHHYHQRSIQHPLPSSNLKREYSVSLADSDNSDEFQMTNRPDSNILSPRTMKATATATEKARNSSMNVHNSIRNAPIPSSYEHPRTRRHPDPSPPPTYRQAQAQVARREVLNLPTAQTDDWPLPRIPTAQEGDLGLAHEPMSQARRGRVLERGSVQIVQVSDRSRSSSMNRNRMKNRGESSNRASVGPIRENDDLRLWDLEPGDSSTTFFRDTPRFGEKPSLQEGRDQNGRAMSGHYTIPLTQITHKPTISPASFAETRDRFQAQSRREREKRRMRLSMGGDSIATNGDAY